MGVCEWLSFITVFAAISIASSYPPILKLDNDQQLIPYPRIGKRFGSTSVGLVPYPRVGRADSNPVRRGFYQMLARRFGNNFGGDFGALQDVQDMAPSKRNIAATDIFLQQVMSRPRHYPSKRASMDLPGVIGPMNGQRTTPLHHSLVRQNGEVALFRQMMERLGKLRRAMAV